MIWSVVALLLLFHLVWFALTCLKTLKPPPGEDEMAQFFKKREEPPELAGGEKMLEAAYIEANGYTLHLDIFPNGRGFPTIVFIPGTSVYSRHYIDFLHAMGEAGFNVVGFDPRGHGWSSGKRGDYTISTIVEDALAVVAFARKRFGGKVAVAGSSQGGIAAFYTAASDHQLSAVVCHNLADLNGRDNQILSRIRIPWWLTPAAQLLMRLYGSFAIPIFSYLDLSGEHLKNGQSAAQYLREDPLCVTWICIKALNSLLRTPLPTPVEAIPVPIMVVHSEYDTIFPKKYVMSIYERLTCKKKFYLVKGRSHLVMINNVDEIAPDIAAWLHETMDARS